MKYNFLNINGVIIKSLRFLFFLIPVSIYAQPQSPTNIDVFYTLVDSAADMVIKDLGNVKTVNLELNFGIDYSVFANRVRGKLLRSGVQLVGDESDSKDFVRVNLVLDNSFVAYSEPEKDGIFGDFYTQRTIKLSGNYFISKNSEVKEFIFTNIDKVKVDDVEELENRSYPFTRGDLPPEPFFSTLWEPIVAIGAAALTVILFFTVRSK
ncbi:MAG TPA: hypothetical protein PK073_01550 [Ignavibacteriaceae bacterium]|jgi:hypothetical protein|nr:MAG: hypothetical protein BWY38_02633 [Ignavibacteria bacterium ADurb.Bin266]OQY70976.1 MAG: hypothetical protein B6D44_14220 [Ignavibacteriales bacterium UTCHB2]HQF41566.1 hypothetical protein [Ignavibacteriaceae bacterium]HQI42072.1 hypothetical protein [Ignavibacteriaceae bacterium]HQJ46181.1 hypothetical protein [Ignavibacteriaceae bacterium]